jgi:hypothetical protein
MGGSGCSTAKHPANGEAAGGTVKPKGRREGAAQPVAAKRAEFSRRRIAGKAGHYPQVQGSVLLVADWSDAAGSFPTATLIGAAKSLPRRGPGQALSPPRIGAAASRRTTRIVPGYPLLGCTQCQARVF